MRSPTPAPRRMAPPQAGPTQATPPQATPPQATPPRADRHRAGLPQADRHRAVRPPADPPPAGAARRARPRWCGPARRAGGWCSRQVLGLAGDLVDELLVVLPRGGHLTAPPGHRPPSDFPMADGAQCCGASAPHPCRCHRTPADVMGRDRNCTGRSMLDTQPAPTGTRTHRRAVRPSGQERTFATDELIVSKIDPRGVITYANDVFLRVSAYPAAEVIGQPHNLIRHPDMPRAVFKLLWDTLAERREGFAYIDNLAADGANYWVLAHMTPSYGSNGAVVGYHSSRRRPSRGALDRVRPLYERLLAEERKHPNARAAVEASGRLLQELVAEQAVSYEEFIWSIIADEEA